MNLGNPYAPQYQQRHEPYYGQPRHTNDNVSATVPEPVGNEHYNFASARGGLRPQPAHEFEQPY
jgi:hypothetical protein